MSKVIGKRSSKWDLTSESRYQADTSVSNTEVDDRSSLYHVNKSKSSWPSRSDWGHDRRSSHADNFHSTELKDDRRDSKNLKRSGRAYREETSPPSRMRGREDDYAVSMSPGLDSWRESNRNRSHSPRNKWSSRSCRSRSRSRSPGHGFKREPERWTDRNENGPKGMNKPCKDFASGRCRRGNQCRFLHDQYDGGKKHYDFALSGNREESRLEKKYSSGYSHPNNEAFKDAMERDGGRSSLLCPDFERGRCHRGSSCKYIHSNSNGGYDGVRHISHIRHELENRRISDTFCKYFANGRCRNGDNCKFSHGVSGHLNPDERLPNAKDVHDRGNENILWDDFLIGAKVNSEPMPGFEARSEGKQDWPEWENSIPVKSTTSNSLQWQMQNGSGGFTAELSKDGDPHRVLRANTSQSSFDHVQTSNADNSEHLPFNNVDSSEHLPTQDEDGRLHVSQKPPDHLPEAVLNSKGQVSLLGSSAIQSSVSHELVQHTVLPPEDNTNLAVDAPSASNIQTFSVHQLGKILDVGLSNNHQFNSMATTAPSLVTIEELPRATEPAALDQVLANGANLAKLYATLGSLHPYSQADHQGSLDSKPVHHSNQYDPLSDSLVQVNTGAISQAQISLLCIPEEKCPAVEEGQNHSKRNESLTVTMVPNDKILDVSNVAGSAEDKEEKVLFVKSKETAEVEVNKVNEENDTDIAEDKTGGEEAKEEERKGKNAKDGRMFKFALVAFVKEILKPTWREGQMSREAHKTIVKKVVDKITGSLRGPNIPQTQETIDMYLSHSKEKVSKLIQAYVEKYKT